MTFVAVAVVGGISTKTLSMFHNARTTARMSQTSNIKENHIEDVTVDSPNVYKEDDNKDLNSLPNEKDSSDNSQNNNDNTNKQEPISSKLEESSDNNDINKQIDDSSQSKDENSNVNTEEQSSTNASLEIEIPTIHYDRTTSIYANDNITLLRVEYYRNNKLTYYSVIEQFDAATKSYIEKIHQCNRETNIDPLIRTDVYVNGNLIKSY